MFMLSHMHGIKHCSLHQGWNEEIHGTLTGNNRINYWSDWLSAFGSGNLFNYDYPWTTTSMEHYILSIIYGNLLSMSY
jgi:hypothetical protein